MKSVPHVPHHRTHLGSVLDHDPDSSVGSRQEGCATTTTAATMGKTVTVRPKKNDVRQATAEITQKQKES